MGRFLSLFHRYGYIYRPLNGGSWASAKENWALTDTEIIKAISLAHDKFYLGARSGKSSRFAVIDIDAGSQYHREKQLERLLLVLEKAGLGRSSLFRSSFSDGWHLYIFFDEEVNTVQLHRELVTLLKLNDFSVSKGTMEVFPNLGKNSQGMGLRLPLQAGWAWLDKKTAEVDYFREEMTATKALTYFLDLLDNNANSYQSFQRLAQYNKELESRRDKAKISTIPPSNVVPLRFAGVLPDNEQGRLVATIFGHTPAGINAENWCRGRDFSVSGLTGPSQRAEAIFCLGHYLFYGDPSRSIEPMGYGFEEERDWAIREFLEARHNGHSTDIARGRADALQQVARAANWRPPSKRDSEPVRYTAKRPISWVIENANRKKDARKRIQEAMEQIRKLGRSFTTVELQEAAACSRRTLYSHKDLWRQEYEDLADGFFSSCTDEYNAVVEAACSESKPPSTDQEKIMPPGRLAARRIAYEISMRSKKDIRARERAESPSSTAAEKEWRDKVVSLTKEKVDEIPVPKLKSLLFVLPNYLSVAPCEEDAVALAAYISGLRLSLERQLHGPEPPHLM